ncbi:MAG: YibE/F family protein [Patescibacteria group bacterium]|jgi:uncharacterized membrane protein|nr:YibE/F family protein [Patescibacteria group bacterium]
MKNIKLFRKQNIFISILAVLLLSLFFVFPVSANNDKGSVYKAEVIDILDELEKENEDGSKIVQQDLLLKIINSEREGEEIIYNGISDLQVTDLDYFNVSDKVFVDSYKNVDDEEIFYITGFVRNTSLIWLFIIFIIAVLLVGRFKGFKALLSLFLSFVVIIKFILPSILNGQNPIIISLLGALIILALIIYITEGIKKKSHLAMLAILSSLTFTVFLSWFFIRVTRLTGLAQEETIFLINNGNLSLDFKGLLLAGFIIGAIGVLDDIVVGQIESVEQIREANPSLSNRQVFNMSYKIGNTHLGAIINTLFLTYTGAALPLLLLFIVNNQSGVSFENFINLEVVSTEIVRTLVGSIGIIASMPIATLLATVMLKKK